MEGTESRHAHTRARVRSIKPGTPGWSPWVPFLPSQGFSLRPPNSDHNNRLTGMADTFCPVWLQGIPY